VSERKEFEIMCLYLITAGRLIIHAAAVVVAGAVVASIGN